MIKNFAYIFFMQFVRTFELNIQLGCLAFSANRKADSNFSKMGVNVLGSVSSKPQPDNNQNSKN